MKNPKHMKISELSRAVSVPATSIRFYVKEGLLPEPRKTSKTMAYYSQEHLERLKFIEKIKREENPPLAIIRELINSKFPESNIHEKDEKVYSNRREDIIKAAIELFREKGYDETSITDIVSRSGIGRGTFYVNFENKEELFIECADRIFYDMYDYIWQEIKDEKDMTKRIIKRSRAFTISYPKWIDMMNLIRGASVSKNPAFIKKLNQVMKQIIEPIIRDIEKGKKQGSIRKGVNSKTAGYMLMGIAEYCNYLLYQNECSEEEIMQWMSDILINGLYK